MKRLTRRCKQALNDEMTKFKKFIEIALSEMKYHEKGNFSTQSTRDIYETNKLYPMADKLASYEDAEEQGLLLRLPFKEGYIIHNGHCHHIDKVVLRSITFDLNGLVFVFEGICEEDDLPFSMDVNEKDLFDGIYIDRDKAEKALKNMEV